VLAVLERYRVPATFFVIGENVAAHAELLRRMIHDGDEIGVHTFTHPDLAGCPRGRSGWSLTRRSSPSPRPPDTRPTCSGRSQTVTAVARLVPALSARGYRFVTVSQAAGQTPPWHQASFSQRARGSALIFAVLGAGWFTHLLWRAFAIAGALSLARVGVLLLFARRHRRHDRQPLRYLPPVSVVVPAYNERAGIVAAVRSLACPPERSSNPAPERRQARRAEHRDRRRATRHGWSRRLPTRR
jgi:hypothetical protein